MNLADLSEAFLDALLLERRSMKLFFRRTPQERLLDWLRCRRIADPSREVQSSVEGWGGAPDNSREFFQEPFDRQGLTFWSLGPSMHPVCEGHGQRPFSGPFGWQMQAEVRQSMCMLKASAPRIVPS